MTDRYTEKARELQLGFRSCQWRSDWCEHCRDAIAAALQSAADEARAEAFEEAAQIASDVARQYADWADKYDAPAWHDKREAANEIAIDIRDRAKGKP